MKLKKVIYATLPVTDQDRALDFYTTVIGLEKRADSPTRDGPRFVTVGVPGQDFDVMLWQGTPARIDQGSGACTFEVEDVRQAFDELTAQGVKFDPPEVLEYPWGWVARLRDPDGNLLQIRQGR